MRPNGGSTRDAEVARGYTRFQRWLNYLGMATWIALFALTVRVLVASWASVPAAGWIAAAAVLVAMPLADFTTGFVHWAADNIGREDWPIIGGFVKPFRNHHVDPEDMVHHGYWEMHGDHFIATLPVFWFATWLDAGATAVLFWKVMWIAVGFFVIATARFHAWAHHPSPPRVARWLQRRGLILSPEHHQKHHTPPFSENYCITNGWMNGPLRFFRFFAACEWIMTVMGAVPLTKQPADYFAGEPDSSPVVPEAGHDEAQADHTVA